MDRYRQESTSSEAPIILNRESNLGAVVTVSNVCMSLVLIVGLIVNHQSAVTAIVTGALYFALSTLASLLVLSGTLTAVTTGWQTQKTERMKIAQHYAVFAQPVDPTPALAAAPSPALPARSFVPAVEPDVAREAVLWALTLYAETGEPSAGKVNLHTDKEPPGRLKVAAPTGAAREYLLQKGVLQKIRNGFRLNSSRYPTAGDLKTLLV